MHEVVSNTTPIISLLKISKIEILKDLYSEIIIPQAVFNEEKNVWISDILIAEVCKLTDE